MHSRILTLATACGAALLAPAALPAADARPSDIQAQATTTVASVSAETSVPSRLSRLSRPSRHSQRKREVRAAELLAAVRGCRQISHGRYRTDEGAPASIPVCAQHGAVHWKADLDVDCDGRAGRHCNRRTDPVYQHATAHQQSDGRQLSAERLPYVVVPGASRIWSPARSGIRGGTVAALVHRNKVLYAVVGDSGPSGLIGEASYAAARGLGIDPDPVRGGAAGEVTYILFPGATARPIESHRAAAEAGRTAARKLLRRAD
ncbi:glycoside hydrolase family 75 protein [Streptomyces sp. NPDC102467]|uniref:glycoside hydrolase family 75 protein n=1 Tax=Streptomyces sp. NPDC102467 TaxID=3366179 RepID=UPI00382DF51C